MRARKLNENNGAIKNHDMINIITVVKKTIETKAWIMIAVNTK